MGVFTKANAYDQMMFKKLGELEPITGLLINIFHSGFDHKHILSSYGNRLKKDHPDRLYSKLRENNLFYIVRLK